VTGSLQARALAGEFPGVSGPDSAVRMNPACDWGAGKVLNRRRASARRAGESTDPKSRR
jgi:hypothetical protein